LVVDAMSLMKVTNALPTAKVHKVIDAHTNVPIARRSMVRHTRLASLTARPSWHSSFSLLSSSQSRSSSLSYARRGPVRCAAGEGERQFGDVCTQISRSFYEACLPQLNVPYEQALSSFAAGCKEAYVSGASVSSVNLQLQMSPNTGNPELDALLSQRGGLQEDEVELRNSWITVCFLTFDEANVLRDDVPTSGNAGLDEERLGIFVKNVVTLAKQGYDAQRVKLMEVLKMSGPDAQPRSDMESAVMSQAIRLVFCALDLCGGRTIPPSDPSPDAPPPPSPPPPPPPDAPSKSPNGGSKPGSKFAARKKAEAERKNTSNDDDA